MDLVLEVFDTFVLDRFFATLLPRSLPLVPFKAGSSLDNGTFPGLYDARAGYEYRPASQFYEIQPSEWAYRSAWPRDNPFRQLISLFLITWLFGVVIYFVASTLSYAFVFDKTTQQHPRFLKNQILLEIKLAMMSLPIMAVMTAPIFFTEIRGYSRLYERTADGPGRWYDIMQFPLFILFTDACIYWIHRGLHHPLVYKHIHKPHHKWIMPTPFASHAFHPIDGFSQGVPYHVFPFIFPLQKWAYIALFIFINIWTVLIHDGEYISNHPLVNGAACHAIHHEKFEGNYGQFTTAWDRIGGTYRKPPPEMFQKGSKGGEKGRVAGKGKNE